MESLIYGGAFDCFKEMHRRQFFYAAPGDISSLEKILKFGSVIQSQTASSANTLFGDLQMPEIIPPKLPVCEPWQLVEQLDFEKEVTGMYMSGHPLDNYKFEMEHYRISPIADFLEIKKEPPAIQKNKSFRLAGLVIDAQHRLTKTGKNYGVLAIEDFTGKTEFFIWQEDYVKYNRYFEKGMIIAIEGSFKEKRFKKDEVEFSISKLFLLETIKQNHTKELVIDIDPAYVDQDFVNFFMNNINENPGNTIISFKLHDLLKSHSVTLSSRMGSFTMNDEMTTYLVHNPYFKVSVICH